ncbi:hypothetical protein COHA_001129 [Chlorella ohadii]|uniref:Protein kinase domain-containing protein n=1 Tax=Chlorella ohadii TaxID=2649997 RepID=A0AAD5H649_9CHLO|nr:hypothetical protein COHA_001129 [Chlorella ohadii]
MASLRHPCVLQYMGICTAPPAIITEYCSKGSLHDVLRVARASPNNRAQLGWLRRLNMALDGAKGMLYLHKRGMVHALLKSTNLLVAESWRVKVADVEPSSLNPRWLAPEVLNGEAATPASDLFSWGVVMWELLTLELPWQGVSPWSIVGKLMDGERPEVPPREQLPGPDTDIFAGLDNYVALMRRCWAQRPEDRPSFEEAIHELRRITEAHWRLPEVQARMLEAQASKEDQQPEEQQLSAEPPPKGDGESEAAASEEGGDSSLLQSIGSSFTLRLPSVAVAPTLCCFSNEITPAPGRAQGGGDSLPADLRRWIMRFEDLEMQLVIGEGSYGKVYKAKLHETLVAVKVLLDYDMALQAAHRNALHTITDPIAASLQQECGLMARLRHPNIVQFMGVSTCPPAMVTEFCSRGSLYDVLKAARVSSPRQPPLTWPRRLSMALDAAKGMLYLHMRGVLHRDLKSANLLVEATWRVKVADFNLSKILGTDSSGPEVPLKRRHGCCWPSSAGKQKEAASISSAGSGCATPSPIVSGTLSNLNPRWLAPEVMSGQAATSASDVFSWGVVMWELLTLKVPWEGIPRWPLLNMRMDGLRLEVPPREQLPGPDTTSFGGLDDYITLMQRCLAEHPEQRPGFEEVIHELRSLLEAHARMAAR